MPHLAGHTRWFVPDCYLPEDDPAKGELVSHESCCILNVGPEDAQCTLTFYFEDQDPISEVTVTVPGNIACMSVSTGWRTSRASASRATRRMVSGSSATQEWSSSTPVSTPAVGV